MKRGHKKDVQYYIPGAKRVIAESTKATADLINLLVNQLHDLRLVYAAIQYDKTAKEIIAIYMSNGVYWL